MKESLNSFSGFTHLTFLSFGVSKRARGQVWRLGELCVCVCVREREREIGRLGIEEHRKVVCFA